MKAIEMKCRGKQASDFSRMRCVLSCVGKDRIRPELQRVLIEKTAGGVYVVGCDGTRLRRDRFEIKAEPGLYEIEVNNSRVIRLVPSKVMVRYPDYRKVIPKGGERDTYVVTGKGSRFALWVGAALGCYIDPSLVPLADDEQVDVCVQKADGGTSPLMARNNLSLLIVMPLKLDEPVAGKLDSCQLDRLRNRRKMTVVKPRQRTAGRVCPVVAIAGEA